MIYISGKVTGQRIEDARKKFLKAERFLKKTFPDQEIVNPLKIETKGGLEWEEYMAKDIIQLMKCNTIYLLSDWVESKGAKLEYQIAKEMGMKILPWHRKPRLKVVMDR